MFINCRKNDKSHKSPKICENRARKAKTTSTLRKIKMSIFAIEKKQQNILKKK